MTAELFSELIDVQSYDLPTGSFICASDYIGHIWQTKPLSFVNIDVEKQIQSLLQIELPDNSFLQFSLIADDYMQGYFERYDAMRMNKTGVSIIEELAENRKQFLQTLQYQGANEKAPCTLRNYILVVSLKLAYKGALNIELLTNYQHYAAQIEAALIGIFGFVDKLDDKQYLFLLRNLLLPKDYTGLAQLAPEFLYYDKDKTLAQQIFSSSSSIEKQGNCLIINDEDYIQVFSPLEIPGEFSCGQAIIYLGELFTGNTPLTKKFLITCNLFYQNQISAKSKLETKRNLTIKQSLSPLARFIPRLRQTTTSFDYLWEDLERGDNLVQMSWSLVGWVPKNSFNCNFNNSLLAQAQAYAVRIKSYFQITGWSLDVEKELALTVFLNALPLGVDSKAKDYLRRYRNMSTSQALVCLPLFAEWAADNKPTLPLISRTGQLMNLDLFSSQTNYNCCIAAQSGSGKSFLVNEMVANLLSTGAQCWIIDIGRSYKRLCEVYNGEFMEFSADADINMNPFHLIHDYNQDADMLFTLIVTMISPKDQLSEFQENAIKEIIKNLWDSHGKQTTLDLLADKFKNHRDLRIQDLATQLFPYTSNGAYGKYFQSCANNMIDILHELEANINQQNNNQQNNNQQNNNHQDKQRGKSRLVILELEELSGRRDLQMLVLLQLIFAINQQMFQGIRARQKVLFIDEAWDLLARKTVAHFIETGYRRFRKYNGSVVTITQSLEDLYLTDSGRAIAANSACQLFLSQKPETVKQLLTQDRLVLEPSAIQQITSLRTCKGYFSEIFIINNRGYGVGRLIVDPKTKLLYSTDATETNALEQIKQEYGCSYLDAINIYLQS